MSSPLRLYLFRTIRPQKMMCPPIGYAYSRESGCASEFNPQWAVKQKAVPCSDSCVALHEKYRNRDLTSGMPSRCLSVSGEKTKKKQPPDSEGEWTAEVLAFGRLKSLDQVGRHDYPSSLPEIESLIFIHIHILPIFLNNPWPGPT